MSRTEARLPFERASANDVVILATDRGAAPMNIGAVLVVEATSDLDFATVSSTLAERIPRVRRLRQRLQGTPPGCGRPVWVDQPDFDLGRHLSETVLPAAPGSADAAGRFNEQVLEVAADLVCTPLPGHRPLWAARWVTGPSDDRAALILVMHHVLTDGVGGLAVLAALADEGPAPSTDDFPRLLPRWRSVAAATWRERVVALTKMRSGLRASRHGLRELGVGAGRPTFAARTSLNRPTGPRRRLTTIEMPLARVLDLAHARGCTLNDVVLTGVTGATAAVLRRRGERPGELVVSVPISARREATGGELGNRTGVRPLAVPLLTDPDARLRAIAAMSGSRRGASRGASAGPMGAVFRTLGALGVFQFFIDHQRLVHTFVTNIHGPETAVHFAGHRVGTVIPAAVTSGNVGVCFDVLSYAGRLIVTVVADPDILPEQALLTSLLDEEFTQLIGGSAGRSSVLEPG